MAPWIIRDGAAQPYDAERLPPRETYGRDWTYVEATTAGDALALAALSDATGGSIEARLFRAAYQAGVLLLPDDARVGIDAIAARAGVSRQTVQAWRRRHAATWPDALTDDAPTVWAWSDIAAWLAIPRRPGRPRND